VETENFEQYREYVNVRLDALTAVFAKAAIGNFESNIDIPETDDKFTQLYVGIQVMLEVIREKTKDLEALNKQLERRVAAQTEELQKKNTLMRTVLRSIADGIVVTDMNADPIMMNPAAERLIGKSMVPSSSGTLGAFRDVFLPDTVTPFPEADRPIIRALRGETTDGVEIFIKNEAVPLGIYMSGSGRPLRDEKGDIFGSVAVYRDISVHKQLEKELEDYTKVLEEKVKERTSELEQYLNVLHTEEAKEKALLESIGDGVIAVDQQKNILYVNQAAEQMLGRNSREMTGKPFFEMVPVQNEKRETINDSDRPFELAMRSGKSISKNYYYLRADGSAFPAAITASPIVLDAKLIGVVSSFRDITRELEINRAKDELVSLVSHQLRTPPTGIKWFAGMLLDEEVGTINDAQRSYLKEIIYNNERMIDVVNAMLSVSRIELGAFSAEPKLTDVAKIVESVLGEIAFHTKEKQLEIKRTYISALPHVMVDPTLIRMILQNLLVNSVKYTPQKGEIIIALDIVGPELHMSIQDTGCGIPPADADKIFTKLFRADNARAIDSSGTGLGLYIVKRIIDELGGHIHFTSEENKGTTFFIRLPLGEEEVPASSA
jgi:PAS domain S-box-containing protein